LIFLSMSAFLYSPFSRFVSPVDIYFTCLMSQSLSR
jgi:hypothetical protein